METRDRSHDFSDFEEEFSEMIKEEEVDSES